MVANVKSVTQLNMPYKLELKKYFSHKWQTDLIRPARYARIYYYLPVCLDLQSGRRLNISSIRRVDLDGRQDSSSILATAA